MFETSKEEIEYEKRLRRRLKILQEKLKEGNVKIAEGLDVEKSLLAVRSGPDGEIDLNTVDGLVRSMALAVTAMHDREELKKEASLNEIQNMYFQFIEQNFGHFYKIMRDQDLTPHDIGNALTQNERAIDEITDKLEEFLDTINQFWEGVGEIAHIHLEDMNGNIKGIFGGDLFPSHNENIASKCGIYTDTIVLPDPFLRSKHIFATYPKKRQAFYLVKHAMNILQYKTLACANVDIPIIAILPDLGALQEDEREFFFSLGKDDSLIHAGKLFNRNFESFDELMGFAQKLDTIEKAVAEIGDKSRFLFDTEWTGDISSQLNQALQSEHYKPFVDSPGVLLASQALGRMTVSNELLIKSRRLNGTPIIDAPTSWKYLAWKMEYDSERAESQTGDHDLHIVKGLQDLAMNEMEWLGNIPPEALIDIRKQGAMDDIREMLGNGINNIVNSNPTDFYKSKAHILKNIDNAFLQHKKNIDELKSKQWKFAGKDIGSWMVTGSLGVAAAVTGMPVWGLAAIAADQLLDAPKLKDIPQSIRDLADESNKVKKSPVGMLFRVRNKST
ncbi:hypothetical protein [Aliivibrio fischeri]|uniref:hypothetical protein n=1 Tax=Aliivibrio fischeri TaxID=668 RepID=UPI00080E2CB0|nr:hypothetical protein [Aliivibrio fischeri]OCH41418.1 hypothetical protein A6E02_15440 [Aliivibrio fischeri]